MRKTEIEERFRPDDSNRSIEQIATTVRSHRCGGGPHVAYVDPGECCPPAKITVVYLIVNFWEGDTLLGQSIVSPREMDWFFGRWKLLPQPLLYRRPNLYGGQR